MDKKPTRELFCRHPDNPVLSVRDWPYDANSVFNAASVEVNGQTLLLVRVEDFRGISHLTVDDVVFPCGWTEKDGTVHMYYGAADSCIAYATAKLEDLLDYVRRFPCHE